jgi:DNA polymerase III subunit epsilon
LPVIAASEQELVQHGELLAQLDKSSGGKTVWRNAEISVA